MTNLSSEMYEFIHGKLISKSPTSAVIDCNGVGYHILISVWTFDLLPEIGEQAKLFVHLVHREDGMELYGFAQKEERQMFRKLIGVSKIGPKLAMAMLSRTRHDELAEYIELGDVESLEKLPRIGRKTAERIVIELKGKIKIPSKERILPQRATEAIEALEALGFTKKEAAQRVENALKKNPDAELEELIKKALGSK